MSVMSPLYSRGPSNIGTRAHPLPDDGSVPHLAGWRCIPTPGIPKDMCLSSARRTVFSS